MTNEVIETRTAYIRLGEDGIIRAANRILDVTVEDMKQFAEDLIKLSGGKKLLIFIDMRKIRSITRDARLFASNAGAIQVVRAVALLIDSPISRVIGNFFLGINKPPYPTRLFTSEVEALSWLKNIIETEKK
jgi:hypothetical protein